jgi:hypothetical protein
MSEFRVGGGNSESAFFLEGKEGYSGQHLKRLIHEILKHSNCLLSEWEGQKRLSLY